MGKRITLSANRVNRAGMSLKNSPLGAPVVVVPSRPCYSPPMIRHIWGTIILDGLVLTAAWFSLAYITSITLRANEPLASTAGGLPVIAGLLLASYLISRNLRYISRRDAAVTGLIWVVILAASQVAIAVPNDSLPIVFGTWYAPGMHLGVFLGPILNRWLKLE